jgi:16S rRNA processing protein RimM
MKQYLEIARIVGTHGIRGDVKLEFWCDSPQTMKKIKTLYFSEDGASPAALSGVRMHGRVMLAHLSGIENPEYAATFRGRVLYANRDDIPRGKNDVFIADLIGLPVIDADTGAVYGTLHDVIENPANDLYEVTTRTGTVLVPAVKQFIARLDVENGVYIHPIPGMFTDAVWHDEKSEDTP